MSAENLGVAATRSIFSRLASKQAKTCAKASVSYGSWNMCAAYACIGVQHVHGVHVALSESEMRQRVSATQGVLRRYKEALKCGQAVGNVNCM